MSRSGKRTKGSTLAAENAAAQAAAKGRMGRGTVIVIAVVVLAIIGAIVGVFYYQQFRAPFQQTILQVDDNTITADYFIRRITIAGTSPLDMLSVLADELIIKAEAPQYVGTVSPEDIDQELRSIAYGGSENYTEAEFNEWYRQQLNESGLSDEEFQDILSTNILVNRLHLFLAERVPTVAEQVHLYAIMVAEYDEALSARERWEEGEEFDVLVQELSANEESKERGGELGWFPRGVLGYGLGEVAFSLATDNMSEPVPTPDGFYLLLVKEKAATREIDEEPLQVLKFTALDNWLALERPYHEIKYEYNSEIDAWIKWQIAKITESEQAQ
jgi:foldase protein PrsA